MSGIQVHSSSPPFASFPEAAQAILPLLGDVADLALWTVVKKEGDEWLPIAVRDRHYTIQRGMRFPWQQWPCSRMVCGAGPGITPDVSKVPVYAATGAAQSWPIGAYIGRPLFEPDGRLFGSVCGVDPDRRDLDAERIRPRLDLVVRILSTFMVLQEQIDAEQHRAQRAEQDARVDHMTGLLNRRGWEIAQHEEQQRLDRMDGSVGVIYADLDALKSVNDEFGHDAGDALIKRCAMVLQEQARPYDSVARIGGDEFALLISGARREDMSVFIARLREALAAADVPTSLGWSWSGLGGSVAAACREADSALLSVKPKRLRA